MKTTIFISVFILVAAQSFMQDLKMFKEGKKNGYEDKDGKVVVPPKYDVFFGYFDGCTL